MCRVEDCDPWDVVTETRPCAHKEHCCGVPMRDRPTLDVVDWLPEAEAAVVAVLRKLSAARGDWNSASDMELLELADLVAGVPQVEKPQP